MKRVFVLTVLFLSIFIVKDAAYSEPLSKFETEVYNAVNEKNDAQDLSVLDENYEKKRDMIYNEVAESYGIRYNKVVEIIFNANIDAMMEEYDE